MLSTLAPAREAANELKPAMTMSIWCTCYSITIIIFRVSGRWLRTKTVFVEDTIMALSILILVARMILVSLILYDGTNNIELSLFMDEAEISRREVGSQLVLVTRMLYALYLWIIKLSVGVYLTRLINQFWAAKAVLSNSAGGRLFKTFLSNYLNSMFYASLVLSFIGVLLSELIECRPFPRYWQVVPDPGPSCRQAYGQLFTMGGFNILTDLFLVALPLPLIIEAKLARRVKLESLFLMLFPLVNIAFTAYRLPSTVSPDHRGSQRYRTLMASLDILFSTASANALVVTSFLQGRGFKKTRSYKQPESEQEQQDPEQEQREGEEGTELRTLGPTTAGLARLSHRSSLNRRPHHQGAQAYRKQWLHGMDEEDSDVITHTDAIGPLGESSPPASLEFGGSARTTTTTYTCVDMGGLPVADDDISERSTSRLSPYAPAQTTCSVDDKTTGLHHHHLPGSARAVEVVVVAAAADGLAAAAGPGGGGSVVAPGDPEQRARRRGSGGAAVAGIVVETTWRVDVSSPG